MSLVKVNASERVVKVTNNGLSVKPANQTKVIKISGTGPQGPAGQTVTPAGAWTSQAYAAYSVVSYQGSSYLSSQATTSSDTPGTSGKWTLLASKGDTGSQGPAGSVGATGPAGAASTVPGPKGDKGDTGATGAQGSSGVIAVTAPITNSGTSTSANIGITTGTTAGTVAAGNDSRITGAEQTSNKGQANGYAGLDGDGKLSSSTIPAVAITSVFEVATQSAQLALSAQEGDVAVRTDESKSYIKNSGTAGTMADWTLLRTPSDTVLSVNGATGAVTLTYSDVGAAASSHTHTMSAITNAGDSATKNVGTSAGTVAAGDHTHTGLSVQAAGTASVRALGTASTEAAAGNHTHTVTGDVTGTLGNGSTALSLGTGVVTGTHILDGTIANADINASAAIAASKISGTALVKTDNVAGNQIVGWATNYWWNNHRVQGQTTSMSTAPAEGTELCVPVMFPYDVNVDRIGVRVGATTAGSTGAVVRLGIRNNSTTNNGQPGTVLIDGGTASTTTVDNYVSVTISSTALSAYTVYWLSATPQGAPSTRATFYYTNAPYITVGNFGQSVNVSPGWISNANTTTGSLPASFNPSIATVGTTQFPMFWLRRA